MKTNAFVRISAIVLCWTIASVVWARTPVGTGSFSGSAGWTSDDAYCRSFGPDLLAIITVTITIAADGSFSGNLQSCDLANGCHDYELSGTTSTRRKWTSLSPGPHIFPSTNGAPIVANSSCYVVISGTRRAAPEHATLMVNKKGTAAKLLLNSGDENLHDGQSGQDTTMSYFFMATSIWQRD